MRPLFFCAQNRIPNVEQGLVNFEGARIENFIIRNSLLDIRYSVAVFGRTLVSCRNTWIEAGNQNP